MGFRQLGQLREPAFGIDEPPQQAFGHIDVVVEQCANRFEQQDRSERPVIPESAKDERRHALVKASDRILRAIPESQTQSASRRSHNKQPVTLANAFEYNDKARRIRRGEAREPRAWDGRSHAKVTLTLLWAPSLDSVYMNRQRARYRTSGRLPPWAG